MAEIKFNFYNIYKNYYRNINDLKTLIIYIEPKYEVDQHNYFYLELFTKFFFNKLPLYLSYEARVGIRIDHIVYRSLRFKNKEKIFYEYEDFESDLYDLISRHFPHWNLPKFLNKKDFN